MTAPFVYEEGGELVEKQIRVCYYDYTTKQLKEQQAKFEADTKENPNALVWNTDALLTRLHSLPDIVDADGKPVEITLDFLDALDVKNVQAIKKAIEEDVNPK